MILGLDCTKSDTDVSYPDMSTVPAAVTVSGLPDRDVELTRNGLDLLASPGLGFKDCINTEIGVGDYSTTEAKPAVEDGFFRKKRTRKSQGQR